MASSEFLAEATRLAEHYQPNEAVQAHMASLDIVTVSGPPDVGANSVMQATGLAVIGGRTTQPRRHNLDENSYRTLVDSQQEEALLADLIAGNLVRVAINPTTGDVYGGDCEDYTFQGVGLVDVAPQEYRHFVQQGFFRSVRATYLTAPRNVWRARLANHDVRVASDDDYRMKRFREAADSLSFSLAHIDDYYFIINDYLEETAHNLKEFALSDKRDIRTQLLAQQAGTVMLKGLQSDLSPV